MRDQEHRLYRFYDAQDRLLYVGITNHIPRRFQRHSEDKPWWHAVAKMTIEVHPDRAAVLLAETNAIKAEKPLYNVRKTGGRPISPAAAEPDNRTDRLEIAATEELDPGSLVGSYFLGAGDRKWQGCVVAEPAPGVYLVETFSWVMGESYEQQLVRLEDMLEWSFYDSAEWMRNAYEHGVAARWERERRAHETVE